MSRRRALLALLTTLALLGLVSCSSKDDTSTSAGSSPGGTAAADGEGLTIGFLYVGPKDDFGYNQAAYEGSQAVAKAYPKAKILQAENVPETADAETVMEDMITQGATIIFPTSYGHLEFAENVAAKHPEVTFVHQGGLLADRVTANTGTYFGTVYEPVYLAGIAAGKATKSNKLGYVYAFPIPQTLANINAFTLGAQSVNPSAQTITVATGSWCDPGQQAQAAKSLLDQGVDVITQHQDCTKTIIEATEKAGAYTVGYHHDASSLAPKGWLIGSEWNWGPMYTDIVATIVAGNFKGSKYNGDYRVGLQTGDNPFVLGTYGPSVSQDTKDLIAKTEAGFKSGGSPFKGPVVAQDGTVKVAEGTQPTYAEVETMDYFVKGVVGKTS